MKEQDFDRLVDAPPPDGQPSFDDERTLLAARPVVPLAKVRQRRHWLLGGAFALAMILGAASALVASYLKLRNTPTSAAEVSEEVGTPVSPVAVTPETAASDLLVSEITEDAENTEEAVTEEAPKPAPAVRRRAIRNRDTELVRPRVVREGNEEDELRRIREAVLIDTWQERRARRAARPERRNRLDHHDRDLSNLDEIFEGRRRRP